MLTLRRNDDGFAKQALQLTPQGHKKRPEKETQKKICVQHVSNIAKEK